MNAATTPYYAYKKNMDRHENKFYRKWLGELDFYEDEIRIFEKKLNDLVDKHPKLFSIVEHVEEYEKIFDKKLSKIKNMRESIMAKKKVFSTESDEDEFREIQGLVNQFVENFENLKKSFKRFLSKNMFD